MEENVEQIKDGLGKELSLLSKGNTNLLVKSLIVVNLKVVF